MHHRIVIVGGGTAGITVAARLRRAGEEDIAVVEPSSSHAYQPLWTLVGGGFVRVSQTIRPEAKVMPRGVSWIKDRVVELDPENRLVRLESGADLSYDFLVVCPGLELNWAAVTGLEEALRSAQVASNYEPDLAEKNWKLVREFRGGTALFCMPGTPIKCPGAPQKAAYLASDHWRRNGVLPSSKVIFTTGAGGIFGVPEFASVLKGVVERYGIDARFNTELTEVRADSREAVLQTTGPNGTSQEVVGYDLLHVAPPQRPPAFVRESPLADPDNLLGWVAVDRHSLRHLRFENVFALGDVASSPNSKTGAAIRRQAPVVVANLQSAMAGRDLTARYEGYAACPFTTAKGKMLLAEFDYSMTPKPSIPFINTQRERYDMWLLKRYGLPFFYWHLMLEGRGPKEHN